MEVYNIEGKAERSIELPQVFTSNFRIDLVRRALLAEQSREFQPQGHSLLAGMHTTARYIGNYKSYRTGRHMGIAIRPRQKLGGGAMGDVRQIPSSTKGRRAHPHKIEKQIVELINKKEYVAAIKSAIAGCAQLEMIRENHAYKGKTLPIVVDDKMEAISKAKDLFKVLNSFGLADDLQKSHKPKLKTGLRRLSQKRHFRTSTIIIGNNTDKLERAGRNIPGIIVCNVNKLSVSKLAPGAEPRITIWTESAVKNVEKALSKNKEE